MKNIYLRKVEDRLDLVKELFGDVEKIKEMLRKTKFPFEGKSDLHNKSEQLMILLNTDIPALIKEIRDNARRQSNP